MGSLENALLLARAVGETVTKVQGPIDVRPMMEALVTQRFTELNKQGPQDLWWEGITAIYEDCMKHTPHNCKTLTEYAKWAEHMLCFWNTVLSAREMLVTWAGVDPTRQETKISPSSDLVQVRDVDPSIDFPKGQTSKLETIGNETINALKNRGVDCFDPWTAVNYRTRLSFASTRKQAKVLLNHNDRSLLCGFYSWMKKHPQQPYSAMPKERIIGKESLRTRTLWQEEIVPERVGFIRVTGGNGITSINEDEAALRIALDLMKASIDSQLPLILPSPKKPNPSSSSS